MFTGAKTSRWVGMFKRWGTLSGDYSGMRLARLFLKTAVALKGRSSFTQIFQNQTLMMRNSLVIYQNMS